MRWCAYAALTALLACGVGFEGSGGGSNAVGGGGSGAAGGMAPMGGSSPTTSAGGGGSSAEGGMGGSTMGGGGAPPLIDDSLVVRYFIDEAATGVDPTALADSAPGALDMPIQFLGSLAFSESSGHRALRWSLIDGNDRASVPISATKIETALSGSTKGTIEIVVDIEQLNLSGTRLSHLGQGTGSGQFTISQYNDQLIRFRMKNSDKGRWPVDLEGRGRTVLHLVFDSDLADQTQRARLFADGTEVAQSNTSYPTQGETITIGSGDYHVLGNRESGGRGFVGRIHYAALYADALSPTQVTTNASALLAQDDSG